MKPAMRGQSRRACDTDFLIVADFNAQNLAALLSNNGADGGAIRASAAPFGQVMQLLLSADSAAWRLGHTAAVVWTSPQAVSNAYAAAARFETLSTERMLAEVEQFARALCRIPLHVSDIFVPTWAPRHPCETRRGLLDMDPGVGLSAALMRMNLRLAEVTAEDSRIRLFDSSRWTALHGARSYDPRLWYLSKTPYSVEVFKEAARDFIAALRGTAGRARKLIIIDLDNTLWGGVLGDVGWAGLRLGGHDAVGEAYRDFQAALKALTRRGILLAIASKNDERAALEALTHHPEMVLGSEDFAAWRINWNDKASNIIDLVSELNLGLDSAVFIDDDPAQRERVRGALGELLVPEWPRSAFEYAGALAALDCFDAPSIGAEDRGRAAMYASERRRRQLQYDLPSLEDWLRTLELTVRAERLDKGNLERTTQLLNKTNQMNLRTRRLARAELASWASGRDHRVLVFRVTDKFGDYGLVGIASMRLDRAEQIAHIEDFVLSCRVMGRKVEHAMLHVLAERASAEGMTSIAAEYLATSRNQPVLRFLEGCGMAPDADGMRFRWDLGKQYPLPEFITLVVAQESEPLASPQLSETASTRRPAGLDRVAR